MSAAERLIRIAEDTGAAPAASNSLRRALRWFAARARTWRSRAQGRNQLSLMTDLELRDIGLTRYDARYEGAKPFWRQ